MLSCNSRLNFFFWSLRGTTPWVLLLLTGAALVGHEGLLPARRMVSTDTRSSIRDRFFPHNSLLFAVVLHARDVRQLSCRLLRRSG
jgi:hypothetical protein